MKKWGALALIAIVAVSTAAVVSAQGAKPEKGIIVGTAVELTTYAMKGGVSEENVEAMVSRSEQGFPVAIIEEETGAIWIPVYRHSAPASHMQLANEHLTPLMGKMVAMQGLKYKHGDVNVIRFSLVSEY